MRTLIVILIILTATNIFAQDVIYKKDNTKIEGKIIKITESEVEYRKISQPNGPIRVISIEKVHQINFEDGTFEVFRSVEKESPIEKLVNTNSTEIVRSENSTFSQINKKDVAIIYKDAREKNAIYMNTPTGLVIGTRWNLRDTKNHIFPVFKNVIGSELNKKGFSSYGTNTEYRLVITLVDILYKLKGNKVSQSSKINYLLINNETSEVLYEQELSVLHYGKYKEIRKLKLKGFEKTFHFALVDNTDKLFQESNFTKFFE